MNCFSAFCKGFRDSGSVSFYVGHNTFEIAVLFTKESQSTTVERPSKYGNTLSVWAPAVFARTEN